MTEYQHKTVFKILMLAGFFSCLLALAGIFSGTSAFAHDAVTGPHDGPATTASEAAAGDADDMKNFLLHVREHVTDPDYGYSTLSAFRSALSEDGGAFRSGSVYVILLDPEDGQVVIHGIDKSVEDRRLLSQEDTELEDLAMLIDAAEADTSRGGVCREYTKDGEIRTSCALLREGGVITTRPSVMVVGYDVRGTDLEEPEFSSLPGSSVELDPSADDVAGAAGDLEQRKEVLKNFVHEAIDAYYIDFVLKETCDLSGLAPAFAGIKNLDRATIKSFISGLADSPGQGLDFSTLLDLCNPAKASLYRPVMRSEDGPWKSGPIYLFSMDDDVNVQRVLFNGLDSGLEDRDLKVLDEGERDVGVLIIDEVRGAPKGEGVFVDYCWDDPAYDGDEVRDENGNPIPGKAPGKSYKVSYVVDMLDYLGLELPDALNAPKYIFGSGIYPKEGEAELLSGCEFSRAGTGDAEESTDDDGGCAIAGAGDTPQGTAFNLFLVMSALFLAVSFGRRMRA